MQKYRIYELAKIYNKGNDEIIAVLNKNNIEVKNRLNSVDEKAKEILEDLAKQNPSGVLFRNSKGTAWTKDSIKCRTARISKKVGFRVIAYGARHSFATGALTRGGVDPISLAHLMGHRDVSMVAKVYSHIAKNPDFLRTQAARALGTQD